ncbi:MAG: vanadium-dependent haloperoxidase [Lewinellaceae bacterium]|nr:vanadium-dependent haloperoxidase [Lewinellaceae bacterium]
MWSDDLPGLTISPAGRWISIANQALAKARLPFPEVMETYLKVTLALCDAGIVVWEAKYRFNVERPESYIRRVIRPDWAPLHDSPSFPAYPSGHSAFGAAAAEVLSDQLGERFPLEDRTHEKRQEFAGKSRSYHSFYEMAAENAASRVLLGVHYRMDCEEGLRLGKLIGQKVISLPLKQKEAAMIHS